MFDVERPDPLTGEVIAFNVRNDGVGKLPVWGRNNTSCRGLVYRAPQLLWEDRDKGRRALLGMPEFIETTPASYSYISRHLPHSLDFLGAPHIHCVSCKPFGEAARTKTQPTGIKYQEVFFETDYEGLAYPVAEDTDVYDEATETPTEAYLGRYVTYTTESRSRIVTLRGGSLRWATEAAPSTPTDRTVFQGHPLRLNEPVKVFTHHELIVENFNFAAADAAINKCNAEPWETRYGLFPAMTMLLENWKPEFTRLPSGKWGLNAQFFFRYFFAGYTDDGEPKGWNWLPDSANGGKLLPVIGVDPDGVTYRMVPTFDVLSLFRPIPAPV